ncbi:hypothetical protein HPB52_012893 [Rhipicephalus sanguineus]|uniref:Uncharacterized protein n=1 Tax=Rhipicephalus sanguineus TaxID=34632 RepID=A0A9D4T7J4_RHISA|nr:hypothetical protein HPB52_012893 [Rhipicephalus sanguineus]
MIILPVRMTTACTISILGAPGNIVGRNGCAQYLSFAPSTLDGVEGAFSVVVRKYGLGGAYELAAVSLIPAVSL